MGILHPSCKYHIVSWYHVVSCYSTYRSAPSSVSRCMSTTMALCAESGIGGDARRVCECGSGRRVEWRVACREWRVRVQVRVVACDGDGDSDCDKTSAIPHHTSTSTSTRKEHHYSSGHHRTPHTTHRTKNSTSTAPIARASYPRHTTALLLTEAATTMT